MENQLILNEFVLILSAAAIFVIISVVIYQTLKQASIFRGFTSVVISILVSLLSLVGLSRFFVISDIATETSANRRDITFEFILMPYSALIIAIILTAFFLFLSNISKNKRKKRQHERRDTMTWR